MMRMTTMMLGGLAMILGGLIAFELLDAGLPAANQDNAMIAFHPAVATAGTAAESSAASVALVLARPLFDPSRTAPMTPSVALASLPRLSGIMISTMERDAVFMPAKGAPIIAQEGARIGVYTVQAITPQSVTVSGPHGVTVLQTSFASDTVSGAAPTPAATFSLFGNTNGVPGSQWLNSGKVSLPNPATWSGPPMLRRLPVPQAAPASSPLLSPSGPPG